MIESGATTVIVNDGGPGDLDGVVNNQLVVQSGIGSPAIPGFTLQAESAITNAPGSATGALLQTNYILRAANDGGGTVRVTTSATGFTQPPSFLNPLTLVSQINGNGTGAGSITGQGWADTTNTLFGMGPNTPGLQGPFAIGAAGGYGNAQTTTFNRDPDPYALTSQFIATLAAGAFTSGSIQETIAAPPAPPVDARISITPDATNEVGQPHTFTATVEQDDGLAAGAPGGDGVTGFGPAAGAITTINLADTNGATATPTSFTGTTNGSGQFQGTFSSPTAGLVIGNATAVLVVGGQTLTRDTDPATATVAGPGGSGPAVKRFVDANITITPDATNEVGQPHAFTVTALENAGDGLGFVPAAGETVTVFLTSTNGATATPTSFTGTTNAAGQLLVTFNSATAGQVIGNATAAVVVGGLTLLRDTDPATATVAGPGGSDSAIKRFVDAKIVLSPLNATNPVNDPHVITATVLQDDGLTAAQGGDGVTGFAPAPNGTVVSFSLINSGGASAVFVGGNTAVVTGGVASVTINSPTAGLVTLNASITFSVGGVTLTRDTDPDTSPVAGPGGSGPAQKIYVRPGIDIEKTTDGSPNANPVDSDYDNEDAMDGPGVPILTPGSTVTWTYKVTNTGGIPFTAAQVVVVDNNGTPGNTADDITPTRVPATDVGADGILSPGEVWLYSASGVVQNLSTPAGPAATFDFSGSSALDGTDGNVRTFTVGSLSVKASGFSRDKGTGAWSEAFLGAYGGGLGVTDSSEGDGSGNTHTVDNVGRDNYVLFRFNDTVVVDSAFLGYVVNDSDLTVWIGTIPGAFGLTNLALSDAVLAGLGFTEVNLTDLATTRLADLNGMNVAGNVIVIAAWTADDTPEDRFKIEKMTVRVAQPGCYENKAVVTVPGDDDSDLSHYCNPNVPPTPGIDIEKTTNGPTNSNPTAPDYDNEDLANGPGVPVLTPGSTVTWTYQVTNTGNVPFTFNQVVVVDDNGTPANTADDLSTTGGQITFASVQVGDADNVLEPGEVWLYSASGTVQNLSAPAPGSTVTFDFSGSSALDGTDGNVRTFTAGTISVKASGFSRDTNGAWAAAYLGSYGGGLGVTDSGEGDGSGNTHTVDNVGRDNYVLFRFNENVIIDQAFLGYVVGDSDLTVWIGTIPNAFNTGVTLSDALLTSLGFTEVNLTDLTSTRWANLNAGQLSGNVLVIAAWTGDDTPEDRFKIEFLKVSKPQPGTYENKATVTVPGDNDSDKSHYKNPTSPPPPPTGSISGKKYKDVSGNGLNTTAGPNSPADVPMAGVTIYLDLDNDGVKDGNEPSKVTNASGEFTFSGLPAGTYRVREVVPAGFIRTAPILSDVYVVDLAAGENETGKNFANAEKCEDCTITNVSYYIKHADGTTQTVTSLSGKTRPGDVIKVTFTVNAPAGTTHPVTFVSYTAPSATFDANTAHLQEIYDLATGNFGPGTHTLTVSIPNCYYQVDLVCGLAIDQFGPAGSNIFYTPQMRLEDAANGGTQAYGPGQVVGQFATVAFWKGTNGQNVIKSFNGGSTQTALGYWLAATFPNLFGVSNPYTGASLAGKTNAQVAAIVANLSTNTTTKSAYAQAFAVALGIYADTRSLGGQSLIDNGKALQFGFNVSLAGGGASLYTIPNVGTATVLQILQNLNDNFTPSTGTFYGGNSSATGLANTVLNGINNGGDIALVTSDSVSTGEDQALITALRPLATGDLVVAVDALPPELAAGEARVADVVAWINASLAEFGLSLTVVPGGESVVADIYLHFAGTSVIGGVPEGVLGVTEVGGQLTIITGWNYYFGSDPGGIGAGQYDFATVIAHELGHAVGLGHSMDIDSVMFPFLGTAQVRRVLTLSDLTAVRHVETAEPEGLRVNAAAKQPLPGCSCPECLQAASLVSGLTGDSGASASAASRMVCAVPSANGITAATDPRLAADFFGAARVGTPVADGRTEPTAARSGGTRAVDWDIDDPMPAAAAAEPVVADPVKPRASGSSAAADWFGGFLVFDDAGDLADVGVG